MKKEELVKKLRAGNYDGLVYDEECGCCLEGEDIGCYGCEEMYEDAQILEEMGCRPALKRFVRDLEPDLKKDAYERGFTDDDWLMFPAPKSE